MSNLFSHDCELNLEICDLNEVLVIWILSWKFPTANYIHVVKLIELSESNLLISTGFKFLGISEYKNKMDFISFYKT